MNSKKVSENAMQLYKKMIERSDSSTFNQNELQNISSINKIVDLLKFIQELVNAKLVKLIKVGNELKFQALSSIEAEKIQNMTQEEESIYSHIEASGREGIWTKTIKSKTNFHQHVINRSLKSLENQKYIKTVKSVKHPTRKIYILYNYQPSLNVTGGIWFTDSELDTDFINLLLVVIWKYLASKTFPSIFSNNLSAFNQLQSVYSTSYSNYPTLNMITDFVIKNKITNIDLKPHDIKVLCDIMIYSNKIELVTGQDNTYKATWESILESFNDIIDEKMKNLKNLPDPLNNYLKKHSFSVFSQHSCLKNEDDDSDKIYLDSWFFQ